MSDYRNIKTPFYDIEVRDPTGKRKVRLPPHILRLVHRIKVVEALNKDQPNTIILDIIEGSREPALSDARAGTSGLYTLNDSIGGSITNRTGAITDLRFSGNAGLTFFNAEEQRLGRIDNRPQVNINGQIVDRSHAKENPKPIFLFQENNLISITFGYLEDKKSQRTVTGKIVTFATDYPDLGPIKSTITATSAEVFLDQIVPKQGLTLGKKTKTGTNNKLSGDEDLTLEDLIVDFADRAQISSSDRVISKEFACTTLEKHKTKQIMGDQSVKNWLDTLSNDHYFYWRMIPKTDGGSKLLVLSKKDLEAEPILRDDKLFTYKGKGSIIKTIKIKADFAGLTSDTKVGLTEKGKAKSSSEANGTKEEVLFARSGGSSKLDSIINNDPTLHYKTCKNINENFLGQETYSSSAEYLPNKTDKTYDEDRAAVDAADKNRLVSLEMTTLGHTGIIPGVIQINGLGIRYSGKYRIMSVEHTIDASGYFTKCTAISFATSLGGIKPVEGVKGKDIPNGPDTKVDLFKRSVDGSLDDGNQLIRQYLNWMRK
jgi:hypothetical protein